MIPAWDHGRLGLEEDVMSTVGRYMINNCTGGRVFRKYIKSYKPCEAEEVIVMRQIEIKV